jgi:hypothetical protein
MMDGRPGSPRRPAATLEYPVPRALPSTLFVAALCIASPAGFALASPPLLLAQASDEDAARQAAAERAAETTGGKVLSAEPDSIDGKPVYRVKVLTPDGHVKTVVIETGAR